jgi:hypothetical protein
MRLKGSVESNATWDSRKGGNGHPLESAGSDREEERAAASKRARHMWRRGQRTRDGEVEFRGKKTRKRREEKKRESPAGFGGE